ncbi:MAG: heme-binding protein [Planctomycetia bacterium]|nr:heme-binding protein [Planctomycetia bacterium]
MWSKLWAKQRKRLTTAPRPAPEKLEARALLAASSIVAVTGDWLGNGVDTAGLYNQTTGEFFIATANATSFAQISGSYGPDGNSWIPLAGDWDGDGDDTLALFDPASGRFFIKNDLSSGAADQVFRFGPSGANWQPFAGDWDGNGQDSVGLYDAANGKFYLKNALSAGPADITFQFGPKPTNWRPIAGDWDGNNVDGVGLYDGAQGRVYLRNALSNGPADTVFSLGPSPANWQPLAGDWDGNNTETVGLYNPASDKFFLRNTNTSGPADSVFYVTPALNNIAPEALAPLTASITAAQLTAPEVTQLLARAAAATASEDYVIAIVDRQGHILGVRVEQNVLNTFAGRDDELYFAIDGAIAKARTAAFFANGDATSGNATPLTSRTIRFISQSTITEREVEGNPNSLDPLVRGPGFVAPIGLGGHFPPEIQHTPPVDLFGIEHTNRDSLVHPGPDGIKGTADDINLASRFNVDPAFIPTGQGIFAPESYGFVTGLMPEAQSRGIATLPGGIPIFRDSADADAFGDTLVGGIGVFFPGVDGYATHEQNFIPGVGQTEAQRTNAPRVLEAEFIALSAIGGSRKAGVRVDTLDGIAAIPSIDLPFGRIDLVGITLETVGPNPQGLEQLVAFGRTLGAGSSASGADQQVNAGGDLAIAGQAVPQGWLVLPRAGGNLSAADVQGIIDNAVDEALRVRAAIRLPLGSRTKMVLSVTDTDGNVLGLFRMPDATYFSIDVAVAKARNVSYYSDPLAILDIDRVDGNGDGIPDVPRGTAMTNRTFRFLAEPRFPSGVDGTTAGPFSTLLTPGVNPLTAENVNQAAPPANTAFTTALGFDAFTPGRNFHDPSNIANQNGVVFFPGSAPLYSGSTLVGGFGVSGDGVDQDDTVTAFGAFGYGPPTSVFRADQVLVRGVRLPYQKFLRNPEA